MAVEKRRKKKIAARVVILVCALGIAFTISASIAWWPEVVRALTVQKGTTPDVWTLAEEFEELRESDYDAYLAGLLDEMLSEVNGYPAIIRTTASAPCDLLDLFPLDLRPGNYMNEHWDYVCVLSVDGRFLEARRIWNHDYWRWDEEERDPHVLYGVKWFAEACDLMEFCLPQSETVGGSRLEVTFVKMKTPEDGLLPIDPSLGWDNFEAYEKVCEAIVPISWLVPTP